MMVVALRSRGVGAGGETMVDLQQSRWFLGPELVVRCLLDVAGVSGELWNRANVRSNHHKGVMSPRIERMKKRGKNLIVGDGSEVRNGYSDPFMAASPWP